MKTFGILLLGAMATASLSAQVVFSDNFSDLNRVGWFSSSTSSSNNLDASGGNLLVFAGRSTQTRFTAASLSNVGDSLALTFDLTMAAPANGAGAFRFGLFNSNGAPVPSGDGNTFYLTYDGIILTTNTLPPSGSPAAFRYRTPNLSGGEGLMSSTTAPTGIYTPFGNSGATAVAFPANTLLNGTFTLTRTIDGVDASFSVVNSTNSTVVQSHSASYTTSNPSLFTYDALGFSNTSAGGNFTLDNVQVTLTAIPEPAQLATLFGLAAVGLAVWQRRRRV